MQQASGGNQAASSSFVVQGWQMVESKKLNFLQGWLFIACFPPNAMLTPLAAQMGLAITRYVSI